MKTKNFLLPALALAMFAAPVIAQDYHEYEKDIRSTVTQATVENTRQHKYLDLGFLRAAITEDLSINVDEIRTAATNSIADNKIEPIYQYDIMVVSIENNRNDILRALLEAGFDKELGEKLGLNSLPAKAVEYNNVEAFALTFSFYNAGKTAQVLEELEKLDPALTNRFFDFVKKCESATGLKKTIKKLDKATLKKFEKIEKIEKIEKPHGEMLMKINKLPAAAILLSKPTKPVLVPLASDTKKEVNNESYVTDTVPAATKTIKIEDDQNTEGEEEGIIAVSYHNKNGTLVIKKFDKPLSDAEYQQWLKNNETMQRIHKNEVTEEKYKQMLDSIRKSQNK